MTIPILKPTQSPNKWVPGMLFLSVNRSRPLADHSRILSAVLKNECDYTITHLICLHGEYRDDTFILNNLVCNAEHSGSRMYCNTALFIIVFLAYHWHKSIYIGVPLGIENVNNNAYIQHNGLPGCFDR